MVTVVVALALIGLAMLALIAFACLVIGAGVDAVMHGACELDEDDSWPDT